MKSLDKIITFIIILYLILRTHGIMQVTKELWIFPLSILIFIALVLISQQTRQANLFLLRESVWIILSIIILITYIMFDYGNFRLYLTFNYLITSLPFYIIGFYYGRKEGLHLLKKITSIFFIFLTFYLLPKIIIVLKSQAFDSSLLNSLFVDNPNDMDFIQFWPYVAFVSSLGFIYLRESRRIVLKKLSNVFAGIILIAFFLSGKAGPFALLLFALIIFYIRSGRLFLKKFHVVFFSFAFISLFVFLVGNGVFGNLGALQRKTSSILLFVEEGFNINNEILDQITSHRWTAGIYSINQFLDKPFTGHGAFLESTAGMLGQLNLYTTASGGHSFVLDSFAFYGVLALPLIMILIKFFKDGFRLSNLYHNKNKAILVYACLMASVFISNILNSSFLFSGFDNFLFMNAGFFLGKYYSKKNYYADKKFKSTENFIYS